MVIFFHDITWFIHFIILIILLLILVVVVVEVCTKTVDSVFCAL